MPIFNHVSLFVLVLSAKCSYLAAVGVPAVNNQQSAASAPADLTRQRAEVRVRMNLSQTEASRLQKLRLVANEPLRGLWVQANSPGDQEQPTSDSGSAHTSQHTNSHGLHLTRTLLLTSMIQPLLISLDSKKSSETQETQQEQHNQHQQRLCLNITALLSPAQGPAYSSSPTSRPAEADPKAPASLTHHICRSQSTSISPNLFRIALPLPMLASNMSTAAVDSSRPQAMLLTLHVQQHAGARAFLWIGSKLVEAGASRVNLNINMLDYSYSWPVQQDLLHRQRVETVTSSQVTNSTTQISNSTDGVNSTDLQGAASVASHASATVNKQVSLHSTTAKGEQQQGEQQQGSWISCSAAAVCPSVLEELAACAVSNPSSSAYAAASMLAASPPHAAWIAAFLDAQNDAAQAPHPQRQALPSHTSQRYQARNTPVSSRKPEVCMHWPSVYDLQVLLYISAAHINVTLGAATTAEEAVSTAAADAAVKAACSVHGNSSSSKYNILTLLEQLVPHINEFAIFDPVSTELRVTAPLKNMLLLLACLLSATAAATAAITSCSIKNSNKTRQQQQALAAEQEGPAAPLGPPVVLTGLNHDPMQVDGQNNGMREMTNSSRTGIGGLPTQQQGDLILFGRSALDQLAQQQQLDAFGELEQDGHMFGYTGAAAVPAHVPAAAEPAAAKGTESIVKAVRRASATAAKQASGMMEAALARRPSTAKGLGSSLLSPSHMNPGRNQAATAAVGYPSTAAKLAAGQWDTADEDAVKQLPASVQERLQTGGRWTRAAGGRLARSSLKAVRAVSNQAAAAVVAAVSGGHAAAAAAAGRESIWQQQGAVGSGSGRDAELLRQLVAAGPGSELGLSDDDEE